MRVSHFIAAWGAITGLFFQAAVPLGQALPSHNSSEPLIVCTQFGPRTIESVPGTESGERRSLAQTTCAICISIDSVRLATPPNRLVEHKDIYTQSITFFPNRDVWIQKFNTSPSWPRAPPILT